MITEFGEKIVRDRYLLEGETLYDFYMRCASGYTTAFIEEKYGGEFGKIIYNYMVSGWFMPSTPVLFSAKCKQRGLPISCYLNKVDDSMQSIRKGWDDTSIISAQGGGVGTDWSSVRAVGQSVTTKGTSSGVIPFIKVSDSINLAISQGSLRRGSTAAFLSISHPEIEEFIDIRKPTGDYNRRCLNIHHGVILSDEFMNAASKGSQWKLVDPCSKKVVKEVSARELYQKIIETRLSTGEPYIVYIDNINSCLPKHHEALGLKVTQSNLCSEITLPTGLDYNKKNRTAVCCLGSVNLDFYDEWDSEPHFIYNCMLFLDAVLTSFHDTPGALPSAAYSAKQERSVGLGVMGFHNLLQRYKMPFESPEAKGINIRVFKKLRYLLDEVNCRLGEELGNCPDATEAIRLTKGVNRERYFKRFSYTQAIAPTATISTINGQCSPSIDPVIANIYIHKTLSGSFVVKNKYICACLQDYGRNNSATWNSIIENNGSVQHLDFLSDNEKKVFRTAFEIDQMCVIDLAADRGVFIDQSQSVNLFFQPGVSKKHILNVHLQAWIRKVKTLYYVRTLSPKRTDYVNTDILNNEECASCA